MNTTKSIYEKLFKYEQATELASHKVELGLIEDIAAAKKQAQQQVTRFLKSDATVQKAVAALKSVYPDILLNKDFAKKKTAELSKIESTLTKQAADLGLDVKQLPAFKELQDAFSLLTQVDDAIINSMDAVKTIGK
jgi:hypothetical protein